MTLLSLSQRIWSLLRAMKSISPFGQQWNSNADQGPSSSSPQVLTGACTVQPMTRTKTKCNIRHCFSLTCPLVSYLYLSTYIYCEIIKHCHQFGSCSHNKWAATYIDILLALWQHLQIFQSSPFLLYLTSVSNDSHSYFIPLDLFPSISFLPYSHIPKPLLSIQFLLLYSHL